MFPQYSGYVTFAYSDDTCIPSIVRYCAHCCKYLHDMPTCLLHDTSTSQSHISHTTPALLDLVLGTELVLQLGLELGLAFGLGLNFKKDTFSSTSFVSCCEMGVSCRLQDFT